MKKVLILNGHQHYDVVARGELTKHFLDKATDFFKKNNFEVKHTNVEEGYNIEEEKNKLLWADIVFFQYPVYWMGIPWITKKYFDEVLTQGIHYENDGRSRKDPSKPYGSGGLLKGNYMLSMTYNCPEVEFNNPKGFFDGLSLDQVHIASHKIFQFIGLKPLKSYAAHDVFKGDFDLASELNKFEATLRNNFL